MKKRIARLAATLSLGALAAAGLTLTATATPQDSAWGADTTAGTTVTVDTGTGITVGATADATLSDTGWG